jgi:CelD/BcsL family acetyltransferase involved in cellulose biosynthesis
MARSTPDGAAAQLTLSATDGLEELREDWVRLGERSGNVFATWEWADVWWRHFGEEGTARPVACRDAAGTVVAILPLYEAFRRPLRVLRFIGGGAGDELGPICVPGEPGAATALRDAAATLGAQVLLAERLPTARGPGGDQRWPEALGGTLLRRESSPVVDLEGLDWDGYLATRSSNFRSQVRRKERKLIREADLSFRLCEDPERIQADLDELFRLHRARWQGTDSGALAGSREDFHREFAPLALERGWLRLWIAEAKGEPVAAFYGFRFGDADSYYQLGRDPKWDSYSVGLVLLAHTVRDATEADRREYRFLRGDEDYKGRFATADLGLDTIALSHGPAGNLAVAAAKAGLGMPAPIRGRLTRAVG